MTQKKMNLKSMNVILGCNGKQQVDFFLQYCNSNESPPQIYSFHDSNLLLSFDEVENNKMLLSDASNIASVLYFLKKNKPLGYKIIIDMARKIIYDFNDFILIPCDNKISLDWHCHSHINIMKPAMLSYGSRRIVGLLTALLQPSLPKIIIFNDPETSLHPCAINALASIMIEISKKTKIVIFTQSPTLIDNFSIEDIILPLQTEDFNKQTFFERLIQKDYKHMSELYKTGEMWEKGIIPWRM